MPEQSSDFYNFFGRLDKMAKLMTAVKVNDDKPASRMVEMTEPPKTFAEIEQVMFEHNYGGKRAFLMFPNGYGASIINTSFSYSTEEAPWELAVMTKEGCCYDTPLTDDVIGECTDAEVIRLCGEIFKLPTRN